jgi:hypothetical protein
LSEDDANERKPPFHYEGGVPIFDVHRIDEIERKQTASEQRDEAYKQEQLGVNKWMMRFTAALVICTIISGGISGYQAHVAKRTAAAASDNAKAAKAQAEAAKAQVDEMKNSGRDTHELAVQAGNQARNTEKLAISANQSMYLGERAWIFPQEIHTESESKMYEVNKPLVVRITFHNTGRSPATNVRAVTTMGFAHSNGSIPKRIPKTWDYSKLGSVFLGTVQVGESPASGHYAVIPMVQQADYDAIASDRLHVFIYGKLTYCDIFGKEHWTSFCYHLMSDGGYAICENNNDVDTSEKPPSCSVTAHGASPLRHWSPSVLTRCALCACLVGGVGA